MNHIGGKTAAAARAGRIVGALRQLTLTQGDKPGAWSAVTSLPVARS
jgi:hypothetical protein